jgi:ABC-2 type transport system permease protein
LLVLISIFSIGLLVASTARDVKQAGMLASLLYFPMLLFSGTTIPYPVFPEFVQTIGQVLPVRQGIILLNGVYNGNGLGDHLLQIGILVGIAIIGIGLSVKFFKWDYGS